LHYAAWEETFAALGLACPLEFLIRHNGKPTDLIVALYNAEFGRASMWSEIYGRQGAADLRFAGSSAADGARGGAGAALLRGRLPMAVVSGSNRANVERDPAGDRHARAISRWC
jgi:beta-phosphoglucomutase-like phosphatase (HAD superfamily)